MRISDWSSDVCSSDLVRKVIVVQATGGAIAMEEGRDLWLHDEAARVSADCPAEPMNAEDPLFILYTSGSTGKPRGVLHSTGGYLLWASLTHELFFDYPPGALDRKHVLKGKTGAV